VQHPATIARKAARKLRGERPQHLSPTADFHSWEYLRHNQRRQEHLASLGLPLENRTVLETGAGIGDHTSFFLDRGCTVVVTEPREENLEILRRRYPKLDVVALDLDRPDPALDTRAEVVYCYGTLYHVSEPAVALAFLSEHCDDLLLLETWVSPDTGEDVRIVDEVQSMPSQAVSGHGSRPTRAWVVARLRQEFPHVYLTTTQPWHEEFPLDWTGDLDPRRPTRAVFVASRRPLDNPLLTEEIPLRQTRH
jgi:Methyltransferase domain